MSLPETILDARAAYVGGSWRRDPSWDGILVENPATGELLGSVPDIPAETVAEAVTAASAAREAWSARDIAERAELVAAIGGELRSLRADLVETIVAELGSPVGPTERVQVDAAIRKFEAMPGLAADVAVERVVGTGRVLAEGVGVVAAVTPWNYPLLQIADKVAPALTAGCTVVLKPSEVTPLNALLLAEAAHRAGLDAGVLSVVTGYGPTAGEALVSHPLVDMVSFTGSTRAGRRISELAAATVKRTAMELGGKSPSLILSDVEGDLLERAVRRSVASAFSNSGQTCSALTRMIVARDALQEVEEIAAAAAADVVTGDPRLASTHLGPLVSAAQYERVQSYILRGLADGGRILVGGPGHPEGLEHGHFALPTIFTDVRNDMAIAREEIFGPVLAIIPVDSDEEGLRAANDTDYGLAAGVWSSDPAVAARFARRIRAGLVQVNGGDEPEGSPFGGFKQSGHGRESGAYGLQEFLTTKTLCL